MTMISTDLVQLVGSYTLLTPTRRGYRGKCPFHVDAGESLMISAEKSVFKCFGCGKEGGTADFERAIAISQTA